MNTRAIIFLSVVLFTIPAQAQAQDTPAGSYDWWLETQNENSETHSTSGQSKESFLSSFYGLYEDLEESVTEFPDPYAVWSEFADRWPHKGWSGFQWTDR